MLRLIPAAGYIRMSSGKQEKSPAEQRAEIVKLAARHGCQIVAWFTDEAITGDSGTDQRAGLADMAREAQAGKFKIVLAWHTNRLTREDPMDALVFYNVLRKAGVTLVTCCEGAIDLEDFAKQLLLFIGQKGNHDFLRELSAKSLRGKISNAKAGGWNGGPCHYGLDRGLFDGNGRFVRRLLPGEYIHMPGHQVRLVPSADTVKVEGVRYAFTRFDQADIGFRQLAQELDGKGYPGPTGKGWTHKTVTRLLSRAVYAGSTRWGAAARGDYYETRGDEIVPVKNGKAKGRKSAWRPKPQEDAIFVEGTHEGIIEPDLFARVQRKLKRPARRRQAYPRAEYPLTGLIYCSHCGEPMFGYSRRTWDKAGNLTHESTEYICRIYQAYGRDGVNNRTCGRHTLDAEAVLQWLVQALQQTLAGPGRDALVQQVKAELNAQTKAVGVDTRRLQKRAADLDREVGRLVKAIRSIDAAELVEELAIVRAERDRVKAELDQAGKFTDPSDVEVEAERIADIAMEAAGGLSDPDAEPAILREVLRQTVSRIDCRFTGTPSRNNRRVFYKLEKGTVTLWPQTLLSVCSVVGRTSIRRPNPSFRPSCGSRARR